MSSALIRTENRERLVIPAAFHPEDNPMEKHDHPTARQRLGDSEAGLGSAATLSSEDADAIRQVRGVQYVAEGVHQNVHVKAGSKRWFTRLHGTDLQLPLIRRARRFGRMCYTLLRVVDRTYELPRKLLIDHCASVFIDQRGGNEPLIVRVSVVKPFKISNSRQSS